MIYLASPYSHPNLRERAVRFDAACRAAAGLIRTGQPVFAPVVQGHALIGYGIPSDWTFWEPLARQYLARCDQVLVLQLDGWRESEGVQAELELAAELGKRVDYLDAETRS
jgi:Domain of unknown function (DUF1937)